MAAPSQAYLDTLARKAAEGTLTDRQRINYARAIAAGRYDTQDTLTLGGAPARPAPRDISRSTQQPTTPEPVDIQEIVSSVRPLEKSQAYIDQAYGGEDIRGGGTGYSGSGYYGAPKDSYNVQEVQAAAQKIANSGQQLQDGNKFYDTGNPAINEALYGPDISRNLPGDGTSGFRTPRNLEVGIGDYIKQGLITGITGAAGAAILGPALGALGGKISTAAGPAQGIAGGTAAGTAANAVGGAIQSGAGLLGSGVAAGGELGANGGMNFAAAAGTPYGGGVGSILAGGPPPDDYADTDFGDMSSIIDNTRMVVQIPGLPPIPTYGMKIEDIKNLPGETWDLIKGVADGSVSVGDVAQKIVDAVGGTLDGAMASASGILAGAQSVYEEWKKNGGTITNVTDPVTEQPTPQSPITGAPEEDVGADPNAVYGSDNPNIDPRTGEPYIGSGNVPDEFSELSSGQVLTSPFEEDVFDDPMIGDDVTYDPDAVYGSDLEGIDPRTGEPYVDYIGDVPISSGMDDDGGQRYTPVENPETIVEEPFTSSSGGGGGGGVGEFTPFMAGISYQTPAIPALIQTRNVDYNKPLNDIINRGMFEGLI